MRAHFRRVQGGDEVGSYERLVDTANPPAWHERCARSRAFRGRPVKNRVAKAGRFMCARALRLPRSSSPGTILTGYLPISNYRSERMIWSAGNFVLTVCPPVRVSNGHSIVRGFRFSLLNSISLSPQRGGSQVRQVAPTGGDCMLADGKKVAVVFGR